MKRHATDRLFVALVMVLAGALVSLLAGVPGAALMVTPWVVLLVVGVGHVAPPTFSIEVRLDRERLIVGDEAELHVQTTSDDNVLLRLTPRPSTAFSDQPVPAIVEAIGAHTTVPTDFQLAATEWGTHDLGRVEIEATPPFGLVRWTGTRRGSRPIRVHPTPRQLRELMAPAMVRTVSGTHRSRESARGIEYADIRQFAAGDSVRDINWRASARAGELWISQRHPDRATDVLLMVDSFVESGHNVRDIFGSAIEASIALAESHLGATDRVGLIEFGGVVRWVAPRTGRVQLQQLVDALLATGLYANAADKELPVLPARALPPRSFVVAMTPLIDPRFIDAIFTIRSRGHDVAVIECEPIAEVPTANVHDRQSAQVSMRLWQAERSMLRDRMAEQGIAVTRWSRDQELDVAIGELIRRRRRVVGGRGR